MATPLTPAGVKVQGNLKRFFVPALSLTAPSLAAINAADALEITNILYADTGWYQKENTTGNAPARVGSTKQWQQFGRSNESFSGDLRYTVDPQAAAGSDGKKAWEKFVPETAGFVFEAPGIDVNADLAVGDFGRVIPVQLGDRNITGDTTDEFAEFTVVQGIIVTAPGAGDLVAVVA